MKGILSLGRLFDVKIELHWTFIFIIAWVVMSEINRGGNFESIALSIAFILLLFTCVVFHEFGHILVARKFGVTTKKITILPIGGVAHLQKIPENPKQELWIAISGPIVNIAIAALLVLFIPVAFFQRENSIPIEDLIHVNPENFLFYLFSANILLVIFNLIPAFPMDGGRVLRAVLALQMDRVKATRIASATGQIIAVFFLFFGFLYNPFLIVIAFFVFISATSENEMVRQLAILKDHKVKEAMLTKLSILSPKDTIGNVIDLLLAGTETNFIVMDHKALVGILYNKDIMKNLKTKEKLVSDVMTKTFKTLNSDDELKTVFQMIQKLNTTFFAVTNNGDLLGAVDSTNLNEFVAIHSEDLRSD